MAIEFVSGQPTLNLGSLSELSAATAFSLAVWVRLAGTSDDNVIAIRGSDFGPGSLWALWRDDVGSTTGRVNTLRAKVVTDAGTVVSEGADNLLNDTDTWHHVAMVFEAGSSEGLRLFVDGVKDANSASTIGHSNVVANTDDVTIGFDSSAQWFNGSMAEFTLWNSVLSDSEVVRLAAGFAPLTLASSIDRLAVYQSFLRGVNHPGIGPMATTTGTLATTPHPRVLPWHAPTRVSPATELNLGPHRSEARQLLSNGSQAAECFLPGAAAGATAPIGKVFN